MKMKEILKNIYLPTQVIPITVQGNSEVGSVVLNETSIKVLASHIIELDRSLSVEDLTLLFQMFPPHVDGPDCFKAATYFKNVYERLSHNVDSMFIINPIASTSKLERAVSVQKSSDSFSEVGRFGGENMLLKTEEVVDSFFNAISVTSSYVVEDLAIFSSISAAHEVVVFFFLSHKIVTILGVKTVMVMAYQSPFAGEFTRFLERGVVSLQKKAWNLKIVVMVEKVVKYGWLAVPGAMAVYAVAVDKYYPPAEVMPVAAVVSVVVPPQPSPYLLPPKIQFEVDVTRQLSTSLIYQICHFWSSCVKAARLGLMHPQMDLMRTTATFVKTYFDTKSDGEGEID